METKSRYEVIAELEANKRNLIKERDSLMDSLIQKKQTSDNFERNLKDFETFFKRRIDDLDRKKETLLRKKEDFLKDSDRQVLDLEKEKEDINRQKEDNIIITTRKLEDSKQEVINFEKTINDRRDTIKELIESIDESLNRFQLKKE